MSKIRNTFAHSSTASDFDSPKIVALCDKLQIARHFDENAPNPIVIETDFDQDIVDIIRNRNFGGNAASVLFARSCFVLTALMVIIIDSVERTEKKVSQTDLPVVASKHIKQPRTRPRRRSRS